MVRKLKLLVLMFIIGASFALPNVIVKAAYQAPDISINYNESTEVEANQVVHLPGPVEMTDGTSGQNGYGHVTMPANLPDETKLTVSALSNVEVATDSNGDQITLCGEAYSFTVETPEEASEVGSYSITLPYCNGLADLAIYTSDGSTDDWTRQSSTHDDTYLDYTVQVDQLDKVGVFSTESFEEENGNEEEDDPSDKNDVTTSTETTESDDLTNEVDTEEKTDGCAEAETHLTINFEEENKVCPNQTILIEDTLNQIVMPKDLPEDTKLTVHDVGESDIVKNAKALHRGGDVLQFTLKKPEGSEFTGKFSLKMPYANGVSVDDIYYYNENTKEWEEQGATFDYDDFTLNVELSHLSTYGVFGIDNIEEKTKTIDKKDVSSKTEGTDEDDLEITEVTVEDGNDDDEGVGGILPSTATNLFNWLLIGAVFVAIGSGLFFLQRRKSSKQG